MTYPDRSIDYMKKMWGTTKLITDYNSLPSKKRNKMLREIENDSMIPKHHDFDVQNELHSRIRNDDNYDDWQYGMEPVYSTKILNE